MRPFVQRMQRKLLARGNGLDELDPGFLRFEALRLVGVENIAQRSGRALRRVLLQRLCRAHGRNFAVSGKHPARRRLSGLFRRMRLAITR